MSGRKSHDFPSVLRGVAKCNAAAGAAQPLCSGTTMTRRASLPTVSQAGREGEGQAGSNLGSHSDS